MARESKGQQVRTFKHHVLQPDLTVQEQIVKVYFQASSGRFVIWLPEHVGDVVSAKWGERHSDRGDVLLLHGRLEHVEIDRVVTAFRHALVLYKQILTEELKERVILVNVEANFGNRSDMSFAKYPSVHFSYEVLWKSGNQLYKQDGAEDPLRSKGSVPSADSRWSKTKMIKWTAEREALLASMDAGLRDLIGRLLEFFTDVDTHVDAMIAGSSPLLLTAPVAKAAE